MTDKEKLDQYFQNASQWKNEMQQLRKIVGKTNLVEHYKWRQPCYTFENKNVCIIGAFNDYCVLSFFKGVLLQDKAQILEKPGPNTRSGRIVKFTHIDQVNKLENQLIAYIKEAIELEKEGKTVDFSKDRNHEYPVELIEIFEKDIEFKNAFEALTPGRKRGYLLHFTAAKNSSTIINRIQKFRVKILLGKGMNDWK